MQIIDILNKIKKARSYTQYISSRRVEVSTLQLKSVWTVEMYDDIKSHYSIDAVGELENELKN